MRRLITLFILFGLSTGALATSPRVPHEIDFANMKLRLTEGARREIQTHVDALYRSPKYFQMKLARVDLYFPVIERVFREEGLPEDFKYLVIQESALIPDAVSSSNAVGFWQFKKASGQEVGLRIDGTVDERLHIVASTRGAAAYLKKNNFYFDNWLYALLSYNMGRGGAQKVVDKKYFGAKKMVLDKKTHWYIKKFLAHKVAFENVVGKNQSPELALVEYKDGANKTLKDIANEMNIENETLKDYNKWLKRGKVPGEKEYAVIVPVVVKDRGDLLVLNEPGNPSGNTTASNNIPVLKDEKEDKYPVIEGEYSEVSSSSSLVTVNGKPGIIAGGNDNLLALADKGEVSIRKFLRYNDLKGRDKAISGQAYYLKSKRGKAKEHFHVAKPGETLWGISQKYGIKLKKLLKKNRLEEGHDLQPGRVLWMRFIRPADEPVEYRKIAKTEVVIAKGMNAQKPVERLDEPRKKTAPVQNHNRDKVEIMKPDSIPDNRNRVKLHTENMNDHQIEETKDTPREEGEFEVQDEVRFVDMDQSGEESNTKGNIHEVKQGETLYGISKKYGIKLGDLLLWNSLKVSDGLNIGQELYITDPDGQEEEYRGEEKNPLVAEKHSYIYHEVKTGETMYKIAREYNVTIKEVMKWNNKKDFNVSVGESLKIKRNTN